MSQDALAEKLRVSYGVDIKGPMISLYESGKSKPAPETWDALADFFDVSLDWLRGRSEIKNPDAQLAALNFPEDVLELARKMTALPNGVRRELAVYADEMIDAIVSTRNRQLAALRNRAESEGVRNWENRHGVKITD